MISKEAKSKYDKERRDRLGAILLEKKRESYRTNRNAVLERRRTKSKSPSEKSKKAAQDRAYRLKNKEMIAKRAKEYNALNRGKCSEYNKVYRANRGDELKEKSKAYAKKNAAAISQKSKERYAKNKQAVTTRARAYYRSNKDKVAACHRRYFASNKDAIVRRTVQQRRDDPNKRIRHRLSSRVRIALRRQRTYKTGTLASVIGCSVAEIRAHLEAQFTKGMSWGNYGKWHIDHIRPCASFDLTDPEQQRQCFHYTNLQPLWAKDNLSKGDRVEPFTPSVN